MKGIPFFSILLFIVLISCENRVEYKKTSNLRAPAYPLINIDPYTNAWSCGDNLYDNQVSHGLGKKLPLLGAVRVDGKVFRFMGLEDAYEKPLVKTSEQGSWTGKYVFAEPKGNWMEVDYSDDNWAIGEGSFGTNFEKTIIRTPWLGEHIWMRREVILEEDLIGKKVIFEYSHDDDVEIYINGIQVVKKGNETRENERLVLSEDVLKTLKAGKNVIAAHCRNRVGNAMLDVGLSVSVPVAQMMQNTAIQKSAEVLPTRTIYTFTCGGIDLMLTFTAPLLMDDLSLLSRPVNYISYEIISNDSESHEVDIYLEATPDWALRVSNQESQSETFEKDNFLYLKTGTKSQKILTRRWGHPCIEWGYFYLCAEKEQTQSAIGDVQRMRAAFCSAAKLEQNMGNTDETQTGLAFCRSLSNVKSLEKGLFMLGYDDIYSVKYFGENLRPYWNKDGDQDILSVFVTAADEYEKLKKSCEKFDAELMRDASKSGGQEYAELCALAYRQTISAHKLLVSPNGDLLLMSKENACISTVDVIYPSSPLFLYYNVDLLKAMLNPVFYYAESGKWTQPFAPHDLGFYPLANGQMLNEYNLPVEESGNMLILTAAIATMEGNALYADKHWNILSKWANFLFENGFNPENQKNTDIFADSSAHNANLSIKGILGIASYGRLADMLGKNDVAKKYSSAARSMALKWIMLADDGDHYRFAFDQPGTWSQKYNLVWDKIMKTNVFPHEIPEKEITYYLTKQNKYGLPLDSRYEYTKADWIVWSATLSPNSESFQKFISPLYSFMNETTDRVPMSDWYWTGKPQSVDFRARPVVGGYFIKLVEDKLKSKRL